MMLVNGQKLPLAIIMHGVCCGGIKVKFTFFYVVSLSCRTSPLEERGNIMENLLSFLSLPLDMQVAFKIIQRCNIWLVPDIETNRITPYFYTGNRFVKDKHWDATSSFIKSELLDLFTFKLHPDAFTDLNKVNELSQYAVSKNDIKKYLRNTGYLNILTNNVLKNIKDAQNRVKQETDFDMNPYEVNTLNGTLCLLSRKLLQHDSLKFNRNIVNAKYLQSPRDIEAKNKELVKTPSLFLKFISDALYDKTKSQEENNDILRSFMEILASFLIGNNNFKLFYILLGLPNTGKSTLIEVLLGIFDSYAATFNNSALMISSRSSNDIRPDLIALMGRRLMLGSEANKREKFDNALVKQISGNDKLSVRKPHKGEMITFTITGKVMLATNYCPNFSDLEDQALMNRIVLIDFNNIPDSFDTRLKDKLLASESRDQIFTYLANIACEIITKKSIYIHDRFHANKQTILINQNSTVSLFWKAHICPYDEYTVPLRAMHQNPVKVLYSVMYLDYCTRNNLKPLALEAFAKEFKLIADQFPMVSWKRGGSNNFYYGFEVENGLSGRYYRLLNTAKFDELINKAS
jgi:phage/plasmid-associated DNA primase